MPSRGIKPRQTRTPRSSWRGNGTSAEPGHFLHMMKLFLKRSLYALGLLVTLPLIILTWLELAFLGPKWEKVFGQCKEILSLVPTFIGEYLRLAYYSAVCTYVSPDAALLFGSMIAHRQTTIRRGVVVGQGTIIGKAEVGESVLFGAGVSLLSGKYQHGRPGDRRENGSSLQEYKIIRIGRQSWIGEKAIVMADVGENCTIGAGAVLMKDAPDNTTFMGNPARKVSMAAPATEKVPPVETNSRNCSGR